MSKNPRIFYTSDTHVGHRLVARERGFVHEDWAPEFDQRTQSYLPVPDTGAHDRALALYWDSTVRPQDTIFILGDISISGSDYALDWHANRPGNKILIAGNHDPIWGFHRDSYKVYEKWMGAFTAIMPFLRRKLEGHYFLMSHFPYVGTGAEGHGVEDRYPQFRLPDMGVPLLHGHTHGKEKAHISDEGTPELHVGLDAWDMQFVEQETVQAWLNNPKSSFLS